LTIDSNKPLRNDVRPSVSVIIVTYRSMGELPHCIESLLKQSVPVEIFLVDNASPDATPQMVADYAARFENVHAILNKENLGLAAGNNIPLTICQGNYVLILNPDTILPENSLERMISFLGQNSDVGVVGPKNLYQDGTPHVSFHRGWGLLHVLAWRVAPYRFTRGLYNWLSPYKYQDVLYVSGACLLIRRSIFEQIGGYDPEYFLTTEDVCDLCIRAKQTGCRVVFLPDVEVFHFTGRSNVQAPYITVWQAYRGTVYHFLKHKGIAQAVAVLLILLLSCATKSLIAAVLGVAKGKYRDVARIYASVFWNLLFRNPIRVKGWRFNASTSPSNAA
jgi:GT2 family glycosyltransferase